MQKQDIEALVKNGGIVQIFALDLNGKPMTLQVHPARMAELAETGVVFDASSVAGMATVEDSDRLVVPLPDTFRVVRFRDETLGFVIGKINKQAGARSPSDTRAVLERVLDRAESAHGCRFLAGPEYEFFLLTGDERADNLYSDQAGYFDAPPHDKGDVVRKRIIDVLADCGIPFEKAHHEVTASQHEINLPAAAPLDAADRTVLFNYVTRCVAAEHGLHATFMPKPFDDQNRNAFHIHLSMQDADGRNLFHDAAAEHGLSKRARQFIGGVVRYARQVSILMASTHNSYKAYVADREAPVVRGWGIRNRSSMVRVPHAAGPEATRIELRCPDPAGNVYLQIAGLIAMGLRGIEEELDCGQPDRASAYRRLGGRVRNPRYLPKCMFEALAEAERSAFLRDLLGETLFERYLALKAADWEEHRTRVTALECREYLSR